MQEHAGSSREGTTYIEYEWKPFRVFLPDFHEWCKANAGIQYCGLTAGRLDMDIEETFWSTIMRSGMGKNVLRIYFINNPGFEIEESVDAKWNSLSEETEEVKWRSYYGRRN